MFFRDFDGWREKHAQMNESANFLIETCDQSAVVELEKSLLTTNRRWKEISDSVHHFIQAHTSEQRAKEHEQGGVALMLNEFICVCVQYVVMVLFPGILKLVTWLQNSAAILKYPAEGTEEEIKSEIDHLDVGL